jgi:hypothetical protein
LKLLVPSALIGGRIPLGVFGVVKDPLLLPEPPSSSVTVTFTV